MKSGGIKKKIVMVGPDEHGQGGVSRVVAIWRGAGFFSGFDLKYVTSTNNGSRKIMTMLEGLLALLRALPSADLVYIHGSDRTSFYRKSIFILLAALFHKKIIMHIHPTRFADFYESLLGFSRKYADYVLNRVAAFVVLTNELRSRIGRSFPGTPVHVLRNPVNVKEMSYHHSVGREDGKLLFLGWYVPAKGVYELVDAVALLKNEGLKVHLDFFGTKDIDSLREYVSGRSLNAVISVNGWIGPGEKLRALYESSMLILPSHSEGIPNVILEAMATKTPIVATCVGGLKEILRDGENALIVRVNDPVDLSNKIRLMLQDREMASRLAENGYSEALKYYDVGIIRKQFIDIIGQVD